MTKDLEAKLTDEFIREFGKALTDEDKLMLLTGHYRVVFLESKHEGNKSTAHFAIKPIVRYEEE